MILSYRGCRPAVLVTVIAGTLLAACVGPTEVLTVVAWEGELARVGSGAVAGGSMAMVANQYTTQIGVGVSALAGSELTWAVHQGSCASPGLRVGPTSLYPDLSVGAEGQAEASTLLNRRVEVDLTYVGVIRTGAAGSGAILACGPLTRID